jgi:hypothetical protein
MFKGESWRVWSALDSMERELRRSEQQSSTRQNVWKAPWESRVESLRDALRRANRSEHYLSNLLPGLELSAVWNSLMDSCEDLALCYASNEVADCFVSGATPIQFAEYFSRFLGLSSIVETTQFKANLTTALSEYTKGFLAAWGYTAKNAFRYRANYMAPQRGSGNNASSHFGQGHANYIAAVLSLLQAYWEAHGSAHHSLLNEIRNSPRLGAGVANWLEQHHERLKQHPYFRSRPRSMGEAHEVEWQMQNSGNANSGSVKEASFDEQFHLVDEVDNYLAHRKYRITGSNGEFWEGISNSEGLTERIYTREAIEISIEIFESEIVQLQEIG